MKQRAAIRVFKTLKNLKSKYRIDTRNGRVFNKKTKKEVAKMPDSNGYLCLYVDYEKNGRRYAHMILRSNLIFWAKHKYLPSIRRCIDHKDGNQQNDRASNLQDISVSQNTVKGKTKKRYRNVYFSKQKNGYIVHICKNYKKMHTKAFANEHDAALFRDQMVVQLYWKEYIQQNFLPPLNFPKKLPQYIQLATKENKKPRMVQMELNFA